jgi:glycosyltransferase involved in cell wall biosynthesis
VPMSEGRGLRIGLDARWADGPHSGVRAVVAGLAAGLSSLSDGDEEYVFLAYRNSHNWLRRFTSGPCRILGAFDEPKTPGWKSLLKSTPMMQPVIDCLNLLRRETTVPPSNGTIEREGIEVMHFTGQSGFLTTVPTVYTPHDLQHLHFPEFFSRRTFRDREVVYRALCAQARLVIAMSSGGRQDLIDNYGLGEDKVAVVPWAPSIASGEMPTAEQMRAVAEKYSLAEPFLFYPAQTWPHKNHLTLIESLALLRQRGVDVNLVCSGYRTPHFQEIQSAITGFHLKDRVRFLGFIEKHDVASLYRLSRGLVFPTLFEGWGLPLLEAYLAAVPVACSRISPLTEQAGDAAVYFDPKRPDEIADAVQRLWIDSELCRILVRKGAKRVSEFSWEKTARLLRAHYRKIACRPLSDEDLELVSAPALV